MKTNKLHTATLSLLAFLSVVMMYSCSLTMDEWIVPEESKGYGEIEEVTNEFFTLKYQYKDSTRSLTDEILSYMATIEDDTVLYFNNNLPEEWLPKVGGCVVANCSPKFPMGFVRKVESVESLNGLYKIVTTSAALEDAYEELDFEFDGQIQFSNEEKNNTRAAMTRAMGAEGNNMPDSINIDWTMYNLTSGNKVKNVGGVATRALEDYEEDVDKTTTEEKKISYLELDETNPIVGEIMNLVNKKRKIINKFSFEMGNVTAAKVHKIVKLSEKKEYTDTEQASGLYISAKIGNDFVTAKKNASDAQKQKDYEEEMKWFREVMGYAITEDIGYTAKPTLLDRINDAWVYFYVPFGQSPFGFILGARPTASFSLGLYGTAECKLWLSSSRTITEFKDKEKIVDKTYKMLNPDNVYDLNVLGNIHASIGGEVFAGVGTVPTKTLLAAYPGAVGLYNGKTVALGASLTANLEFDLTVDKGLIGAFRDASSDNNAMKLVLSGDYGGRALGGLLDCKFFRDDFKPYPLIEKSFFPKISVDNFKYGVTEAGNRNVTMAFTMTDLGLGRTLYYKTLYLPKLLVFENEDLTDANPRVISCSPSIKHIDEGARYDFEFEIQGVNKTYYVVPCVYPKYGVGGSDDLLMKDYKHQVNKEMKPMVEYYLEKEPNHSYYNYIYQMVGEKIDPESYEEYADKLNLDDCYELSFALPFRLYGASTIAHNWSDWGIKYRIYWDGSTSDDWEYVSFMNNENVKKNGIFVPRVTVLRDNPREDGFKHIEAWLYYVDIDDPKKIKRSLIGAGDALQYTYKYYDNVNLSKPSDGIKVTDSRNIKYKDFKYTTYDWDKEGMNIPVWGK